MPPFLRPPGGERTFDALLTMGWGALLTWLGARLWASPLGLAGWLILVLGIPLLAAGVALWCRRSWARLPAVIILGLVAATEAWGLRKGVTFGRVCLLVGSGYLAWSVWRNFSPAALAAAAIEEGGGEDRPMTSLVLLLRRPRHLEAALLARYVEDAWGGTYRSETEAEAAEKPGSAEDRWVVGRSPLFMLRAPEGLFIVHNRSESYFSEAEKMVDEIDELRMRKLVEECRAWISVDLMVPNDPAADRDGFYPQIARLISALSGPDCLALFRPEDSEVRLWDDGVEEKLRGPEPMAVFGDADAPLPVINVPDDDPRMQVAVEEARAGWGRFTEAFAARAGEHFAVKAPVTADGNTEFIWIEVDRLEGEAVLGRLGNDPVELGDLKLGSPVTVPVSEVRDWAFFRDGKPEGMFSVKVLQAIHAERQAAANDSNS